jgi:flagellar hook-associated protein 2
MSISFGGLSSGLPVNDIIAQLIGIERQPIDAMRRDVQQLNSQKSVFTSLKSITTALQTSLKKVTATSVLDTNLFNSRKATSSDEAALSASVTKDAAQQTLNVEVKKLATSTRAASTASIGNLTTGATALNALPGLTLTSGNFSVFVNGVESSVAVDATVDTLDDVLGRINALSPDITGASVVNGQLQVQATGAGVVRFGSSGDTSNFLKVAQLDTATDTAGTFTGGRAFNLVNVDAVVSDVGAGFGTAVTAGSTFKINGQTFDTTGKSLGTLLQDINNNSAAKVTASFNRTTNKLELSSKDTGALPIQLQETSGNFLTAMGIVGAGGDSLASQTLGQNAEVVVNGTTLLSTSNTLDSAVSGLTGISLNLKKAQVGTTVSLEVGQDTEALTKAMEDFTKKFNEVNKYIKEITDSKTGALGINSGLTGLRQQLRNVVSSPVSGLSPYGSMGAVGISTGAAGAGGGTAPVDLVFDQAKFLEALKANPNQVEQLFRGPSGIFTQLQTMVDGVLKVGTSTTGAQGLLQAQEQGLDARVKRLNDNITRAEERLVRREALLKSQFTVSEGLISQYQAQGQAISGLASAFATNR